MPGGWIPCGGTVDCDSESSRNNEMFLKNQDHGDTVGTPDLKGLSAKLYNPGVLFLALAKFSMEDHQRSIVSLAVR